MRALTDLQSDVLDTLDAVYPAGLTTNEVAERRTGSKYDNQDSYRALRQLQDRGLVTSFRGPFMRSTSWAVIR